MDVIKEVDARRIGVDIAASAFILGTYNDSINGYEQIKQHRMIIPKIS